MLFVVIVVVFFLFFFNILIPLVVNSSVFVANLFDSTKKNEESKSLQVFGRVEITDIPVATNSATFAFSGFAEGFDFVYVYLNGDRVKKIDVEKNSNFHTEVSGLHSGDNDLYLEGRIANKSTRRETSKFTITYKQEKPKLEVSKPEDNYRTPQNEISVIGKTDSSNTVRVNDAIVIVNSAGDFQTTVLLKDGENKIKILSSDSAGNTEEKTITIFYEK